MISQNKATPCQLCSQLEDLTLAEPLIRVRQLGGYSASLILMSLAVKYRKTESASEVGHVDQRHNI